MEKFHKLTQQERDELIRLFDEGRLTTHRLPINSADAKVCYHHDGNFTTALVRAGNKLYVGTAKRNPTDRQADNIGNKVARVRAFRSTGVSIG